MSAADRAARLRARIQKARETLALLEVGLGALPEWDQIVARRLDAIEGAIASNIETEHGVVHTEVVERMIREHGALLAADRRKARTARRPDEESLTAVRLADSMISYDGPDPLYPWLRKLPRARAKLVAAIEAVSHKAQDTDDRIRLVLLALGLDRSAEARRQHRLRAKRDMTR